MRAKCAAKFAMMVNMKCRTDNIRAKRAENKVIKVNKVNKVNKVKPSNCVYSIISARSTRKFVILMLKIKMVKNTCA